MIPPGNDSWSAWFLPGFLQIQIELTILYKEYDKHSLKEVIIIFQIFSIMIFLWREFFSVVWKVRIERLRNENEDKTKTEMTQSLNQYSENETKIWRQNILNQFNRVSSSCLRSHFVISLITEGVRGEEHRSI